MKAINIDRDGTRFAVKVTTLARTKITHFDTHADAVRFSLKHLTRTAVCLDTCHMTAEQLTAHRERQAALRASLAKLFAPVPHTAVE